MCDFYMHTMNMQYIMCNDERLHSPWHTPWSFIRYPCGQRHLYVPWKLTQFALLFRHSSCTIVVSHSLTSRSHLLPNQPVSQTHPVLTSHSFAPKPHEHECIQFSPYVPEGQPENKAMQIVFDIHLQFQDYFFLNLFIFTYIYMNLSVSQLRNCSDVYELESDNIKKLSLC